MMELDDFAKQLKQSGYDPGAPNTSAVPAPAAQAAANPAEQANPYADFAQAMRTSTEQQAVGNLVAAQDSNPDAAARSLALAPKVGVPAPAIEQDVPSYEKQAQLQQNRQILGGNPVLAQWVAANPPAARVAQDDFDKLDVLSKLLTAWKSGGTSAIVQNQLGRLYNTKQGAALTGAATPDTDQQIQHAEGILAKQPQLHGLYGGVQQFSGFAAGMLDNIISGAPEAVGGALLGAAATPEALGAGAIPGAIAGGFTGMKLDMARVAAGLTYRTLSNTRDAGGNQVDEAAKQVGALLSGAITYGVAGIGGGAASKVGQEAIAPFVSEAVTEAMTRPTVAAALRTAAMAAAKGGVTGTALNAAMDGAQIIGEEAAKQISAGQFNTVFNDDATRQQAITRLADAAESGALLFGGLHGVGAGVHFVGDMMRVRQAQADVAMFQQLQDGAADSATRARAPDAFVSFLQSQTDGSPVENLFVPAERIMQLYQSKGIDPSAAGPDPLFGWMGDMRKQLEEALPLGGDVVLPTADYIAHMAGTDVSRELLPDIRVRQDGMSMNEARTFAQSAKGDLERDAQTVAGLEDPTRQIFDDISQQAQEAGYAMGAAQQYGTLYAARYAARAARLGVDPMDLYRQSGVEIRSGEDAGTSAGRLSQDEENARGAITIGNGKALIELFKGHDMSTLLHESGHLWLEELRADAERPDAPQQLRDDFAAVTKWMGVDDGSKIEVEHHEQFARAAEAYFMEGKAPSGALASAFAKFKAWLTTIYRSIASLNTPINDDIRGVFDRLIATDAEIDSARRAAHLRATFRDPTSAGMTEKEFAEYAKTVNGANAAAESALLPKVMEHVRKKRGSDYDAYRAKVKEEVTRDVDARPEFQALEALRTGKLAGDDAEGVKLDKLSAKDIDAAYGAGTAEKLPKGTTVKRGGVHPDNAADVFGFGSGDELVKALIALEQQERDIRQTPGEKRTARQYIIDRRTDFRMSEERPDILSDGSIRDEAIQAIHNQEAQKALQIELRALGRRIHQEAFSLDDVRQWAKEQVAGKTVRDVQLTGKYSRAEAIAARRVEQALLDGDHAGAYAAKRQQILNHHLFLAAREAADEIQSGSKELNRYANKRTIKGLNQEYLDQIHALLDRFDFGDASQREVQRRASLRDWAQRQYDKGAEISVPAELLNEAFRKHFSELTVEQFRGLKDTVDQIAHQGKLKQTLLDGADERDFDSVVNEAVAAAGQLPEKRTPLERNPGEGGRGLDRINAKWLNAKSSLRSLDASMLKMEQVFDWLDQHDSNGVFNRVVFRRLADAGVRENDLRSYVVKQLRELHDKLPVEATRDWLNRYELPELKDSRTGEASRMLKKDIIAMALNVGNESNFEKLMRGEAWSRGAIWTVLNRHMTKADWDFVQGAWDLIESLWPHIEGMEKRLSGVAPDKVRPTEVSTPFGRYRGGYYPAIYDPLRAYDVELNRQRSGDKLFENNYTRATTDKGHTIERIQDYARPLYLNLDVLPRHLTGVIHDLAYREAIIDADRFLGDERVRESIEKVMGREIYKQFRPWLQAIANDKVYDQRGLAWWDRAAHWARTSATMVGLGFRFTTMMIHGATAASNSVGEIGARWMLSGIHAFDTPAKWAATRDFVFERSGEMRNRMNEVDRDVRDALREMEQHSNRNPAQKAYDGARRFAYYGISMLDMGSAMPTWVGAYNKSLHEGMSEQDAVYAADKAVRNAHGGGGSKDLAAIQRGPEFQKLFTMFYSFWNHFYNRQRDIGRRAVQAYGTAREGDYGQAARDFAMVAARSWFYFVIPQLIHAALKPAPGQQQHEDQSWPAWAAEEIGLGLLSGIPVFRDIASAAMSGRDYEATPAAQMVNSMLKSGKDIAAATGLSDHEVSDKWVKHAMQNAGYVFGLPTGQVSGSVQFLWDVMHGDQNPQDVADWLHGIVYGKVKE
ncbi:hypothetical protein NUJ30_08775 [Burkholderia contaminans]|uniref:hypothetical protein n=1 Tax=Burkholderia contaminans TaxID=488447 RepID=UPI00174922E9|nr:hypothetical protein [Burkholderia contaminans]MBD1412791.1 hypothetical protein [Burkholderia contaminans]UXZ68757.1 hypothetical protein NUJ29_08780 [Burkholderia contaminans]UXZ76518.1 hypothetical protein NUJ30_08775 [Burkholderia contaminans]